MTTLLIWDSYGEEPIRLYSVTGKHEALVRSCDGQYINALDLEDAAPVFTLNELLGDGSDDGVIAPGITLIPDGEREGTWDAIVIAGWIP